MIKKSRAAAAPLQFSGKGQAEEQRITNYSINQRVIKFENSFKSAISINRRLLALDRRPQPRLKLSPK